MNPSSIRRSASREEILPDSSKRFPNSRPLAPFAVSFGFARTHLPWLAVLIVGSLTLLRAQDQLTPATLSAWTATGTPPVAQGQSAVTVTAGGQLSRVYPAGSLQVHLVSQPFFGATADACPGLLVGPAGVTFVRTANSGGMVLLGDQAFPLPSAIPLGADGRSLQPIDLSLTYDSSSNAATLALDGTTYTVTATAQAAQLQVTVSAGSTSAWALDTLAVTSNPGATVSGSLPSPSAAGVSSAPASPASASASGTPTLAKVSMSADPRIRKQAFESAVALAAKGDTASAEKALASVSHYPANSTGWELEMANGLVQVVVRLRADGKLDSSAVVARLVLQYLDQCVAVAGASEGDLAGSALDLAGMVEARFFGDLKSAESDYRKALQISSNLSSAQAALDRLLSTGSAEQQKLAVWGTK